MFKEFKKNRFSIVLACRQSGKSISVCAYLLWYALFNPEKTIAILANKGATAREMLARITLMLENIPFYLQPGTKALNKGSIEFSNNSRIIAAATSGSSIRGLSVNLLYLDEFAFVERASEFYTSTYPVVTAGSNTKVIITSTANGIGNTFHKLWEGAVQNVNVFKPFRVDWWDVPGRNDKWKEETILNTSQLQFDQEFGNTFFGTGDTLINTETL
ncbi:MAG: terminase, partial [Flavobacteriaceae bacterium]|nr:terminase [Flavobacteriaceae bacterium]